MSLLSRSLISLFAGIGAGLIGYWAVRIFVHALAANHPGTNYDAYLICGIFVPFIAVTLAVYWTLSREPARTES